MPRIIGEQDAELLLGYWAIRGLAQPIRFLLACAGASFGEVRYGSNPDGTTPEETLKDWLDRKPEIGLEFPNLPYLFDRGVSPEVRVTQSNAVMRYLGRRFDLYGASDAERTAIDVLQDEAYDLRNAIVETAYTPESGYPEALAAFSANAVPRHLDGFERHLSKQACDSYFVGGRLSLVDFILYELVWQCALMVPGSVSKDQRAHLSGFLEHFEQIPQIAAYMRSPDYLERPINGHSAYFR